MMRSETISTTSWLTLLHSILPSTGYVFPISRANHKTLPIVRTSPPDRNDRYRPRSMETNEKKVSLIYIFRSRDLSCRTQRAICSLDFTFAPFDTSLKPEQEIYFLGNQSQKLACGVSNTQ
ncbi:uncharacterized protein BP01DRAFT_174376 [Aspergillus saccharolyticus JOP 1030-1]|uniref:Uncharacterized protein n=1 Tax=Aspergillus saccharolyticus JOP 1030-1 TaxID=1450539 RepID=A0A318ZVC3_9EURO|nr:hypothetical protein BP01DRAFT_174376 [Aspergillus saccharolyticus JOP 1030-1]PYH48000.1 hypothetical protein BP01DRAFT_174376 [Aspergillus saccharolyticus JOP 1030-1]